MWQIEPSCPFLGTLVELKMYACRFFLSWTIISHGEASRRSLEYLGSLDLLNLFELI